MEASNKKARVLSRPLKSFALVYYPWLLPDSLGKFLLSTFWLRPSLVLGPQISGRNEGACWFCLNVVAGPGLPERYANGGS